jgi:hypothetical protein
VSSPASRKRQRHRRRAEEKIWDAQTRLADRKNDLAAYDHVLADMKLRYREGNLSPFTGAQAVGLVTSLRDDVKAACDRLIAELAELEIARQKLVPASDPKETMSP